MIELSLAPALFVIFGFIIAYFIHKSYWKHFEKMRSKSEHVEAFRNEIYLVVILYTVVSFFAGPMQGWLLYNIGWLLATLYQIPRIQSIKN
jgi:fatty acid desaturase